MAIVYQLLNASPQTSTAFLTSLRPDAWSSVSFCRDYCCVQTALMPLLSVIKMHHCLYFIVPARSGSGYMNVWLANFVTVILQIIYSVPQTFLNCYCIFHCFVFVVTVHDPVATDSLNNALKIKETWPILDALHWQYKGTAASHYEQIDGQTPHTDLAVYQGYWYRHYTSRLR